MNKPNEKIKKQIDVLNSYNFCLQWSVCVSLDGPKLGTWA